MCVNWHFEEEKYCVVIIHITCTEWISGMNYTHQRTQHCAGEHAYPITTAEIFRFVVSEVENVTNYLLECLWRLFPLTFGNEIIF